MKKIIIEGVATIESNGFHFDSGMPSYEPVLDEAMRLQGTLSVSRNACADFEASDRVCLPPEVHAISEGMGYKVKRTSRHYLIQLKVPIVESRIATQDRLVQSLPTIMGDITIDRRELLGEALLG